MDVVEAEFAVQQQNPDVALNGCLGPDATGLVDEAIHQIGASKGRWHGGDATDSGAGAAEDSARWPPACATPDQP
ncbi:Glutamate synthase [NADPH] large chain [Nocardioides sp. PD653]|nr:Glutamate synthase [NADPH] large chain [Nocardioides sp. PD653-B2]GAW55608.1 Glutamate synthase [NADPH] large chain [Nocardioides sp. PD653]